MLRVRLWPTGFCPKLLGRGSCTPRRRRSGSSATTRPRCITGAYRPDSGYQAAQGAPAGAGWYFAPRNRSPYAVVLHNYASMTGLAACTGAIAARVAPGTRAWPPRNTLTGTPLPFRWPLPSPSSSIKATPTHSPSQNRTTLGRLFYFRNTHRGNIRSVQWTTTEAYFNVPWMRKSDFLFMRAPRARTEQAILRGTTWRILPAFIFGSQFSRSWLP